LEKESEKKHKTNPHQQEENTYDRSADLLFFDLHGGLDFGLILRLHGIIIVQLNEADICLR